MQSLQAGSAAGGPEGLARRLGFSGPVIDVPSERWERWCARSLERLAHAGDRQGVELLVSWPSQPGPAALQRWVTRLARSAPLRRFLHLSIEPDGSLLLGMSRPGHFALGDAVVRLLDEETWAALARIQATGREHLSWRLTDLLGREVVTRRFFRQFREHLLALEEGFTGVPETAAGEAAERRDLAMTTLCRLMFVTFLARAGRLGPLTSPRWIAEQPRRRGLYREVLRGLFFGVLNTPVAEREPALGHLDEVPFLNGGLFQPLPAECSVTLDVPDEPLLSAIDVLFESYDFGARERDVDRAVPVIDPEMLGQVFETLMQSGERRGSGSYYTPPALVRELVGDLLGSWADQISRRAGAWVRARLAQREVEPLPAQAAARLEHALARLRLLDPAVGSGAFLLGALQALVSLRVHLAKERGGQACRYRLTRQTITQNLYGVDRKRGAVRLCELRLWLSLAVEAPPGRALEPLPNLDHRIRQGDSLSGPGPSAPNAGWDEDGGAGRDYADLHGAEKDAAARQRRTHEAERLTRLARLERGRVEVALAELSALAESPDLFGRRVPLPARQADQRRRLASRRRELLALEAALARGELPHFSYRAAFPEVAAAGGFDLILGNPPWVRIHDVPADERQALRRRYRFARKLGSGFQAQVDLSVLFVERALELAAPGGLVGLLLPAKLFRARYGRRARQVLRDEHTPVHFADLSRQRARLFNASNYPAWLLVRRGRPRGDARARTTLVAPTGEWHTALQPVGQIADGDCPTAPWIALPQTVRSVLDQMREGRISLSQYGVQPALGLKTGRNRVFLSSDWEPTSDDRVRLVMADSSEFEVPERLAPLACHGRDLEAFAMAPSQRLLAAYERASGRPLKVLEPALHKYFERHAADLRGRSDAHNGRAPWRLFRTRALEPGPKVIWRDIAPRLEAVFSPAGEAQPVPLNTAYFLTPADPHEGWVLTALLNARWVRFYAVVTAEPAMGGYHRFMAWTVGRIPWPSRLRLGSRNARRLELLCRAAHAEWTPDLQAEIDERVAWAYGLSPEARRVLNGLKHLYPEVSP